MATFSQNPAFILSQLDRSSGQWQKSQDLVDEALDACPLSTIRRFFRRADRCARVYRLGATGSLP
ncbi:hypothetical protein B0H19DRAFT_1089191 [Mycena capillaripes]|nr:hypothetical protein B0H19DRAFT_1089191 [Mycena capillaripes]